MNWTPATTHEQAAEIDGYLIALVFVLSVGRDLQLRDSRFRLWN